MPNISLLQRTCIGYTFITPIIKAPNAFVLITKFLLIHFTTPYNNPQKTPRCFSRSTAVFQLKHRGVFSELNARVERRIRTSCLMINNYSCLG